MPLPDEPANSRPFMRWQTGLRSESSHPHRGSWRRQVWGDADRAVRGDGGHRRPGVHQHTSLGMLGNRCFQRTLRRSISSRPSREPTPVRLPLSRPQGVRLAHGDVVARGRGFNRGRVGVGWSALVVGGARQPDDRVLGPSRRTKLVDQDDAAEPAPGRAARAGAVPTRRVHNFRRTA